MHRHFVGTCYILNPSVGYFPWLTKMQSAVPFSLFAMVIQAEICESFYEDASVQFNETKWWYKNVNSSPRQYALGKQ